MIADENCLFEVGNQIMMGDTNAFWEAGCTRGVVYGCYCLLTLLGREERPGIALAF